MSDDNTTKDAFLDGGFFAMQPSSGGHRSGVDALLLAAQIPRCATGRVADLGSGCGVAGLAVAHQSHNVVVDLVEIDPTMLALARATVALPENLALADRVAVVQADVLASGKERQNSKLCENTYDYVIANPPYNLNHLQRSKHELRAKAHALETGQLEGWVKTATAILKSGGQMSIILRPDSLPTILNAMAGRMGDIGVYPIHSKIGEPAKRLIVSGIKGSRAPLKLHQGRILHRQTGEYAAWADAIFRGRSDPA